MLRMRASPTIVWSKEELGALVGMATLVMDLHLDLDARNVSH